MDSDLAWVNGKSSRQSWRYADAFQHSIISEAIYHFNFYMVALGPKFDSRLQKLEITKGFRYSRPIAMSILSGAKDAGDCGEVAYGGAPRRQTLEAARR